MTGKRLTLHADGASLGNPGPAAIGVIIEDDGGQGVTRISRRIGETTNNRAEYLALIAGLEEAARQGAWRLDIRLDSELIVKQLRGEYKSKELAPLYRRAVELMRKFSSCTVGHIPGSENRVAHDLAHRALGKASS
jgi:ribonuclease HI